MKNEATLGQAMQLLAIIKQSGGDRERVQAIIDSGLFSDLLLRDPAYVDRAEFRRHIGLRIMDRIERKQPEYEELLRRFESVPAILNETRFVHMSTDSLPPSDPAAMQKPLRFTLEQMDGCVTGQMLGAIRAVGRWYRAATYEELLAYQQAFPEDWKVDPDKRGSSDYVAALGSVTAQGGKFPAIFRCSDKWRLQLHDGNMGSSWPHGTKFLCVQYR